MPQPISTLLMRSYRNHKLMTRSVYTFHKRHCLQSSAYSVQAKPLTIPNTRLKDPDPTEIWHYNNRGIRNRKIKQLFRNAEKGLETEDVLHIKRIIEIFQEFGFTQNQIEKLIYSKAQLLQLSKTMLRKRIKSLRSLDLPKESVKSMIIAYPGLLMLDHELPFQKRLNILQELNLFPRLDQQRCLYLIQKCPQLLSFAKEKKILQEKIDLLRSYGLHEQQIFQLVMKCPAMLTINKALLDAKLKFLTEKMNGRITLIVKFPRFLTTSMKRLKERHAFLIEEHFLKEKTHFSEKKLRALVLSSDSDFVYKVTKTKMKDYRDFLRQFELMQSKLNENNKMKENNESAVDSEKEEMFDDKYIEEDINFEKFVKEYENMKI